MAVDAELLAQCAVTGAKYLRLYRWDPPALSIGRNQSFEGTLRRGVAVVRRPTGGKAVWHEHELTYAVAAPVAAFGSLRTAYCEIHTRIARALRSLGVDAALAPYGRAVRPSDGPTSCFAMSVGGEIVAQGGKLVGSAQVRRGDAFLQHGSILLGGSQERAGGMGETTLAVVLGRTVRFEEVARAIVANWGEKLGPTESPSVRPSNVASIAAQ